MTLKIGGFKPLAECTRVDSTDVISGGN